MAKKKKISFFVMLTTGIVWGALYFGVIIPFIGLFFDFDFLSRADWLAKYHAFLEFKWNINTWSDTLLFLLMIFWIPIWVYGWWRISLLNWQKLKPKPRPKVVLKKAFEIKESKQLYQMPRKMPSVVQASRYVAPKLPNQADEVVSGAKSHTNLVQMIRLIATLAKKYQVEIFQHILLEGNRVPMAISTDARAVLVEIVNKKGVNWSVEFTDDVTQGNWYSEGGVMDKLAKDLLGASASLAKSEPNSEVLSAIVVTDGRVLNAKQAVAYFQSKGIFLLGYNKAEPKNELPDLPSFLSAYFDLKAGEIDPAPHPVEKVPLRSNQTEVEEDEVADEEEIIEEDDEIVEEEEFVEEDEVADGEEIIEEDGEIIEEEEFVEEDEVVDERVENQPQKTNIPSQMSAIRAPLPRTSFSAQPTPTPTSEN